MTKGEIRKKENAAQAFLFLRKFKIYYKDLSAVAGAM